MKTDFEQHMRKYHPNSTTARLSREVEDLRAERDLAPVIEEPFDYLFGYTESKDD